MYCVNATCCSSYPNAGVSWNINRNIDVLVIFIFIYCTNQMYLLCHPMVDKTYFNITKCNYCSNELGCYWVNTQSTLKCPYYKLWKVHILVLGVPKNRLTCMQGQKTLSLSYNMLIFLFCFLLFLLLNLLNDSQIMIFIQTNTKRPTSGWAICKCFILTST